MQVATYDTYIHINFYLIYRFFVELLNGVNFYKRVNI